MSLFGFPFSQKIAFNIFKIMVSVIIPQRTELIGLQES